MLFSLRLSFVYVPYHHYMVHEYHSEQEWKKKKITVKHASFLVFTLRVNHNSLSSSSVQFTQSCLTLCDPMNRSTPGLPVHHQLPELGGAWSLKGEFALRVLTWLGPESPRLSCVVGRPVLSLVRYLRTAKASAPWTNSLTQSCGISSRRRPAELSRENWSPPSTPLPGSGENLS